MRFFVLFSVDGLCYLKVHKQTDVEAPHQITSLRDCCDTQVKSADLSWCCNIVIALLCPLLIAPLTKEA